MAILMDGTEHKLDPNGVVGKFDPAVVRLQQHSGIEQGIRVGVHRLHIATDPARRFA